MGMSPQCASARKTILIVDDDRDVLNVLQDVLGRFEYSVLPAQTPEEAIAVVKGYPSDIDLMVVDAVMPNMSGPELADILLFLRPHMKVLFITGLDGLAIRLAFDHPCDCLQKPFSARLLVAKVQDTLGEARQAPDGQIASALDC
jgi:DNA-binding NtrC family response regulator